MLTTILLATLLLAPPTPTIPQAVVNSGPCLGGAIPDVSSCVWCIVSMQPGCLTISVPREAVG
jgi:hypothetical protein